MPLNNVRDLFDTIKTAAMMCDSGRKKNDINKSTNLQEKDAAKSVWSEP